MRLGVVEDLGHETVGNGEASTGLHALGRTQRIGKVPAIFVGIDEDTVSSRQLLENNSDEFVIKLVRADSTAELMEVVNQQRLARASSGSAVSRTRLETSVGRR